MIVAVLGIIGLSVGITKSQKEKKLNDLEGGMENAGSAEVENTSDGDDEGGGEDGDMSEYEKFEIQALYKNAAQRYQPLKFDRFAGWLGETYTEALVFCGSKPGYALTFHSYF